LNHYEVYCEKAKARLKEKQLELSSIEGEIKMLMETVSEVTEADLIRGKETLQYLEEAIITSGNALSKARKQKDELQTALVKNVSLLATNQSIKAEIGTKRNRLSEIETGLQRDLEQMSIALKEELRKCGDGEDQGKRLNEIQEKIKRAEKLMMNLDTIRKSITEKQELEASLKSIKENIDKQMQQLRNVIEHKQKLSDRLPLDLINDVERKIFEASHQEAKLKRDLEKAESEFALINEVPCDEITGSNCQFLKNAHLMREAIPTINNELKSLHSTLEIDRETLKNLKDRKQEVETEIAQFEELTTIVRNQENELRTEANRIETELVRLEQHPWESLLQEALKAENDIKLHQMEIEALAKEDETMRKQRATIIERYEAIEDEKRRSAAEMADQILGDIRKLEEDCIDNLEESLLNTRYEIQSIDSQIERHTEEIEVLNARVRDHQAKLTKIELELEAIRQNQVKINAKQTEKILIESEVKDFAFLAKAFDKTGIPVLKLENSGVEISSRANELLSLFENKFRIVFETTSWTKDKKKLKETFLINVLEDDGVCNLSDKSGGQQVWLETAIQLAISLVVRQQGRRIETSFLDEKDGALDIDNAYSYVQMLEKAHTMSGVHNTFIITHRPELLDMIPQKVMLKDGFLQTTNN
jgi:DNA repair exonuclease SbcCD ATPase subunit